MKTSAPTGLNWLNRIHSFITGLAVAFWLNLIACYSVTALFYDGYQANARLSRPLENRFIASKGLRTRAISESRYYFDLRYCLLSWVLWSASWPLLCISHLLGKYLDKYDPPLSRRDFEKLTSEAEKELE